MPETATPTTEPIGLAAAAAECQASAARAEGVDASMGAEGAELDGAVVQASADEWLPAVELALDTLDQLVLRWNPTWEPTKGPLRDAGVAAWARYLQTVATAPGPLAQALAFTAGRYGPPLYVGWQLRRAKPEPDADDPRG